MSEIKLNSPKVLASLSAGMAAAFVPQFSQAALITVGGDGGTGSVTLNNGDTTNLGGVLGGSLSLSLSGASYGYLRAPGAQRLFRAVRSSVSATVAPSGAVWTFNDFSVENEGAAFGSDDNWLAGYFSVTGVNGGDLIYGWLQIALNGAPGGGNNPDQLSILNFTYDDAATDTTAFTKPIGGFSLPSGGGGGGGSVPEPGTLGLAALALGAAGITRRRRFLKQKAAA